MGTYENKGINIDNLLTTIKQNISEITPLVDLSSEFVPYYNGSYDCLANYVVSGLEHIKEELMAVSDSADSYSQDFQMLGKIKDDEIAKALEENESD